MRRTPVVLAIAIALASIAPAAAFAQPAVEAERLFRDGKALRAATKYAAACAVLRGAF